MTWKQDHSIWASDVIAEEVGMIDGPPTVFVCSGKKIKVEQKVGACRVDAADVSPPTQGWKSDLIQ